ncbi:MAG: DUF4886 domain-containing protein [Peptococcaceae bacterium]|nr:DUF4886 domain-containing protein [Peptococcaceae bacterium]
MKRSMRVSFAFVFALFVIPLWFVSDVCAAEPQEKTVTVTFTSYDGNAQVENARETRTIYNGVSEMIPVPPLSDYPDGWEARGWVASETATSSCIDPRLITSLWISDDITFYGVYERQVELAFDTGDNNVQAPANASCPQFVNSSDVTRMYGGRTFLLPPGVIWKGTTFDGWALNNLDGTKYPAESLISIDLQGAGGATMHAVLKYTIRYNGVGGTDLADQTKTVGMPISLRAEEPIRSGLVFKGWALNSSDPEPEYLRGREFDDDEKFKNGELLLYAVWHSRIIFDAAGGSFDENFGAELGADFREDGRPFITRAYYFQAKPLPGGEPAWPGYKFRGWSQDPGNSNARVYAKGEDFAELIYGDYILCAVWEADGPLSPPIIYEADELPSNFDVYLCIGASNMAGQSAAPDPEDLVSIPGVLLFNGTQWETAQFDWRNLTQGLNRYNNLDYYNNGIANQLGAAFYFAKTMQEQSPGRTIGIVADARGSSDINDWSEGGACYNGAVAMTQAALEGTGAKLRGIIIHQGTTDFLTGSLDPGNYARKLNAVVDALRTKFGVTAAECPFIAAEIPYACGINPVTNRFSDEYNSLLPSFVNTARNTDYVSAAADQNIPQNPANPTAGGLETRIQAGDAPHFTTASQREMGKRYALKMLDMQAASLLTYTITFDPMGGVFDEDFDADIGEDGLAFRTWPHIDGGTTLPMRGPKLEGHTFQGWTEDPEESTVSYPPGTILAGTNFNRNLTLFAVWEVNSGRAIRILVIGNSYSQDGMDYNDGGGSHLFQLLKEAGYTDITLGILYRGSCSLEQHWVSAASESNDYEYQTLRSQTSSGVWDNTFSSEKKPPEKKTMRYGIRDEAWDVIVLQQVSGFSHDANSFDPWLSRLIGYIDTHKTNLDVRLGWHMTWAYGLIGETVGTGTLKPTQAAQDIMYNSIISAVERKIVVNPAFDFIIPTGIAIQEMRGHGLGSRLIRDLNSHLSYSLGRYTASMTWLQAITGTSVDLITWRPAGVNEVDQNHVRQSVNVAMNYMYDDTTWTESDFDVSLYNEIDWHYADLGYWNSIDGGYDENPRVTRSADNSKYYLASKRFSKEELPVGSKIVVDEGYGYRPEGWAEKSAEAPGRPLETTQCFEVGEDWWDGFEYRAFNVYQAPYNSVNLTGREAEVASHFRIYVPAYKSLDWRATDGGYWNSPNGGYVAGDPQPLKTAGNSKNFLASGRYSREDLPVGTVIEIDPGYQYRPEGWGYQGIPAPGRPPLRPTQGGVDRVVVNQTWWGNYEYRGFNVTTDPEGSLIGREDDVASHFRILVPLSAYEADAMDYSLYNQLDLSYESQLGFWLSNSGRYDVNPVINKSADNSGCYLASSQRYTREDLPVGSVIEIDVGYFYRPEGWAANGAGSPGRPDYVTKNRIVIDEEWWEGYEYRAFNIAKLPYNLVNLTGRETETASHFRIYVPAYKSLDWRVTNGGYWNSPNGGYVATVPGPVPVTTQVNSPYFLASGRYSQEDLPGGTLIEIDPGYQYRPDGWGYQGQPAPGRPLPWPTQNVVDRVGMDHTWWEKYEYRGFNVCTDPQRGLIGREDYVVSHFRILVPMDMP